jgi:hypothetical protein
MTLGIAINSVVSDEDSFTEVVTPGNASGEGIKLTPSLLAAELVVIIPENKNIGFRLNLDKYMVIEGTGQEQSLEEYILATDNVISIITDEVDDLTFYLYSKDAITAQVDYATEIRERLPEDHIINQDPENPGRILIDECIGRYFAETEIAIFKNTRSRFLPFATGIRLDQYGEWFGIPRNGLDDNTYRANIISLISADITIEGLKTAVASILNLTVDDIDVTNTVANIATAGSTCTVNNQGGVISRFDGYFSTNNKQITITVPFQTDITILESVIQNLIMPGIEVTIDNGYLPI